MRKKLPRRNLILIRKKPNGSSYTEQKYFVAGVAVARGDLGLVTKENRGFLNTWLVENGLPNYYVKELRYPDIISCFNDLSGTAIENHKAIIEAKHGRSPAHVERQDTPVADDVAPRPMDGYEEWEAQQKTFKEKHTLPLKEMSSPWDTEESEEDDDTEQLFSGLKH
jgi:hypothetical protein